MLGSDASAELINAPLILAVLHCDGFVRVCECVSATFASAAVHFIHDCMYARG